MQTDDARSQGAADADTHKRADYILERGMWRAACRDCRYSVQHADRQRASILFRSHQRQVRLDREHNAEVVDLRTELPAPTLGALVLGQEQHSA